MKQLHLTDARLDDYLDDLLSGAAREEVEAHLRNCPECEAEVRRHRELLARLASLPRAISPGVDLRPEIHARILSEERSAASAERSRALHALRYPLAAAAVLLVVLSSSLTLWTSDFLRRVDGPAAPPPAESASRAALAEFRDQEMDYARATDDLQRALREQRDRLDPATVALVERNLRVIDRAIAESRAALQADPDSRTLQQLVLSTYERKLDVLRRAAALSASS